MRLPTGTIKEFKKALDDAHPRWAKLYIWLVGLPAWLYLFYRFETADKFEIRPLDEAAFVAFFSASLVSTAVLFRAFWRNDV